MTNGNSSKLITIIGGSGFLGRHAIRTLARRGYRIRVAVRRPDLAGHLQPSGKVGQIMAVQANLRYPDSLLAACRDADVVINMVGVLYDAGPQTFDAVHAAGAAAAARAARAAGAGQFIQISAIGAAPDGAARYARTKAEGEARAAREFPGAIVLRPSIVFGPEDQFFNRFAGLARFAPFMPVIGGGTRFQPVFVGDVAEGIARIVDRGLADGRVYEFGGPEIRTFRALLEFTLKTIGRRRLLVPVPFFAASLGASIAQVLPRPLLTVDQVELLKSDNVVSEAAIAEGRTLAGLGVAASGIEAIVPSYLYRYRKAGQFTDPDLTRGEAG
ncbi:MAG TPA: complex I NDUFA9 subunit family protein [Aestuariivirgaceae bacterium]|nr:complex I NDUFA9 subunit family protein [Aestuariivirgaceae bacterium]